MVNAVEHSNAVIMPMLDDIKVAVPWAALIESAVPIIEEFLRLPRHNS
jgi:hypothetical protein